MHNTEELDKGFMLRCIELAQQSVDRGDAPFGSLVAKGNDLIAEGLNDAQSKVSEHAEVIALHNAHQHLGTSDLSGCTLYTSCEPCPMCSFMIREYKISRVVYALPSPFMGGHTKWPILQDDELERFRPFFGKPPIVVGGFLEKEAKAVMEKTIFWMFGSNVRNKQ
ncbi:MAG: nucleoside deaminase [Flavobacteriales bacterium]|nr:nucleoside deaminase [Flavobacteriales bacterium]